VSVTRHRRLETPTLTARVNPSTAHRQAPRCDEPGTISSVPLREDRDDDCGRERNLRGCLHGSWPIGSYQSVINGVRASHSPRWARPNQVLPASVTRGVGRVGGFQSWRAGGLFMSPVRIQPQSFAWPLLRRGHHTRSRRRPFFLSGNPVGFPRYTTARSRWTRMGRSPPAR